jgi:hypothetical protein
LFHFELFFVYTETEESKFILLPLYPVFLSPFIEELVLSLIHAFGLFVKNQLTANTWFDL